MVFKAQEGSPSVPQKSAGFLRELLQKLKGTEADQKYTNRFLKFYYNNKSRLLKERKSWYYDKKKNGICVRCSRMALEGIIFCDYHQQKQVGYNKQAREK